MEREVGVGHHGTMVRKGGGGEARLAQRKGKGEREGGAGRWVSWSAGPTQGGGPDGQWAGVRKMNLELISRFRKID
jgi:hypothetical protein